MAGIISLFNYKLLISFSSSFTAPYKNRSKTWVYYNWLFVTLLSLWFSLGSIQTTAIFRRMNCKRLHEIIFNFIFSSSFICDSQVFNTVIIIIWLIILTCAFFLLWSTNYLLEIQRFSSFIIKYWLVIIVKNQEVNGSI